MFVSAINNGCYQSRNLQSKPELKVQSNNDSNNIQQPSFKSINFSNTFDWLLRKNPRVLIGAIIVGWAIGCGIYHSVWH